MNVCDFTSQILKKENGAAIAVTGHYGSGKSLVAVNLAMRLKALRPDADISLCDLDIVNPYFRSADSAQLLAQKGIRTILQEFANTNVDIPSLPPQLNALFEKGHFSVLDIGGDDSGAVALGGYADKLIYFGYFHLAVVNFLRPLTETPEDAFTYVKGIESACGLPVTHIINNTNLGAETKLHMLTDSHEKASELSHLLGNMPVVDSYIGDEASLPYGVFPLSNYTKHFF